MPNPARGNARITFAARASQGEKSVTFYDVTGREVGRIASGPGESSVEWTARDSRGEALTPGLYFALVKTEAGEQTAKIVLMK